MGPSSSDFGTWVLIAAVVTALALNIKNLVWPTQSYENAHATRGELRELRQYTYESLQDLRAKVHEIDIKVSLLQAEAHKQCERIMDLTVDIKDNTRTTILTHGLVMKMSSEAERQEGMCTKG